MADVCGGLRCLWSVLLQKVNTQGSTERPGLFFVFFPYAFAVSVMNNCCCFGLERDLSGKDEWDRFESILSDREATLAREEGARESISFHSHVSY